jgi:signal transduction histidine kinase
MTTDKQQADSDTQSSELSRLRARIPELERQAEELSRARQLQAALFQISELTHDQEDVHGFYPAVHGIVGSLMYAKNFFIAIRDPDSDLLRMEYFRDAEETGITPAIINERYSQKELDATLFAYVIRSGKMLHVDQRQTEALSKREGINVYGVDSVDWLGVPLQVRDETFGALVVQSYDDKLLFNEADEQLLTFVNQHIATALRRKWNEDALRGAKDELEDRVRLRTQELSASNRDLEKEIQIRRRGERIQGTLFRIAQLASEPLDLQAFYQAIHQAIGELIDAPNLYVALRDDEAGMLRYPYIVDQKDGNWPDEPLTEIDPETTRPTMKVLLTGEPLLFLSGETAMPEEYEGYVPEAWLGVPLKSGRSTIGLLAIQSFHPATRYDSRDKELLTFVAQHIATAITRRQAKQALQQANDELEQRVLDRTAELQSTNDALRHTLEQLETAQGQLVQSEKMASLGNLVAGVAHEINTPLGVAVTAATHLEERCKRFLTSPFESLDQSSMEQFQLSATEAIGLVLGNLRRAAELVASFKQVAADQSTEDRRVFALGEYLEEIAISLRPRLRKSGHELSVECPSDIQLDGYPAAIYRIVSNLVINSLIHAFEPDQAGRMQLSVVLQGDHVVLTYRDDGRGLEEAIKRRVFEPFFTTRRGEGGTGLGMHIAYNHVVQLGGNIQLNSAPGEGVCFVITLPLKAGELPTPQA